MPYYRDGKCVYLKDSGKLVGCSDSVAEAKRYLRKLEMTMAEEKQIEQPIKRDEKDMMYDQSEVNYTTLSQTKGKACANCRWLGGMYCHIVENYPLAILPTGYCDQWTALPPPENPQEELIEVLEAIESGIGVVGSSIGYMEKKPTKSFKERLLALVGYKEQAKARDEPLTQSFKALGNGKWIGVWSNNFEDREGEYFPNHATDAYIARLDSKETPMPELVFWHTHYAYGQAKSVARIAAGDAPDSPSLSIAVGEFYADDISKAFEQATLKSQKNYKMSHGYLYPDDALIDGVYHYYDTFEISVLPDYAAANPYTLFGDEKMPAVTPEKQKELEALLGKEYAAEVVSKAEQRAKELAEKGIGYKDKTIPTVDSEARQGISELKSTVVDLATSIKELVTELKAAKPADDKKKDDDEDKMDKLFGGKKKELDDAIAAAKAVTAALEAKQKEFDSLTPRRASKDKSTEVDKSDPLVAAQLLANEQATEAKKEFNQLFGGIFQPSANGAG